MILFEESQNRLRTLTIGNQNKIYILQYYIQHICNNFIRMTEHPQKKPQLNNSNSLSGGNSNMKNNKITNRNKSQSVIRNYSNPRYHEGVDLAKAYSGMVDSHLYQSGFENHALKSIRRYYDHSKGKQKDEDKKIQNISQIKANDNKKMELKRTKSLSTYNNKKIIFSSTSVKPIKVQNNRIILNNPQDAQGKSIQFQNQQDKLDKMRVTQLRTVLSRKTERVPQYSEEVQGLCNWKIELQAQIKKLKNLINSEKKHRIKLSLNCNKIMNENELTHKAYQNRAEENYHLSVASATTQKQIQFLNLQINNFKQKNLTTLDNINNQEAEVLRLKEYVNKTRMVLMGDQKDVAKLKSMVTTSYNNMSNQFMNMNLLKSQKALLLADIDAQHARNK